MSIALGFVIGFLLLLNVIQYRKLRALRIRKDPEEELPYTGTPSDVAPASGLILIVEEDAAQRQALRNDFAEEYQVAEATDGREALELAHKLNPDILITDVLTPQIEGDELCRQLKSSMETCHISVVIYTPLDDRESIIMGLQAGASDYIIRPCDPSILKVRIQNILQNRQRIREEIRQSAQPKEIDYVNQLDKNFMGLVQQILTEHMDDSDFSVNEFCQELGMSRTSVFNKIKTLTGQGPNEYIRTVRLNKAKELLLEQRYSVSDVAVMVGFSDPKYFSTCFKKQFDVSPSKIYKKEE